MYCVNIVSTDNCQWMSTLILMGTIHLNHTILVNAIFVVGLWMSQNLSSKGLAEILDDDYQFDTFLIGAALPAHLYEKEDRIRARFKIRGRENIKSQFMRDLRKKFRECTKKQIDFLYPDIVINLQFEKETTLDINIKMRPIIILGRYVKKNRGIPQRKGGDYIGCDDMNMQNGFSPSTNVIPLLASTALAVRTPEDISIQSILSREILKITKGERLKFSWIGSEDEESLVSGSGRPFFVQVRNPKTIRLNKRRLNFPRYGLFVNIERYFKKLPEQTSSIYCKDKNCHSVFKTTRKRRCSKNKIISRFYSSLSESKE